MRAIALMIVVGMSGFVLGPLLGGTAPVHVQWEWLLVVNAQIALFACIGVRLGVPADRPEGLTHEALGLAGAMLSITTIGLACWSFTSGVSSARCRAIAPPSAPRSTTPPRRSAPASAPL
jgi:MFS family permease